MNERRFEEAQDLPIDPRITIQMSHEIIRYLYDAIVELVTNSDDSYKRLERDNIPAEGVVKIHVRRGKGGKCEMLEVIDFAEGMDEESLREALVFAGESSGFQEGKSVRGLFGRGLKEAIIALGKGEIYSIRDDKLSIAEVWTDKRDNRSKRRVLEEPYVPSKEEREKLGIMEGNGTVVRIVVTNEQIKCPPLGNFVPQIRDHYALRDINSVRSRKIRLEFESPGQKNEKMFETISYEGPKGKRIVNEPIKLPRYGDKVQIKIYESDEELESPYNNPFARAGLLIKTSGAILDNQLFKYQREKTACFFFGEVIWHDLADRLRKRESLLDLNRVGVEWRQEVCQVLESEIERILEPFIEEKRRQLEVKPARKPSEKVNKLNKAICSLLNRLAKEHFSETRLDTGLVGDEKIKDLTIKPPYANLEIEKERPFSVYAPLTIIGIGSGPYQAEVRSSNPTHIQVLNPTVTLQPHRERALLYYGNFRVLGKTDKEEAIITCKFSDHIATANVRVAPPGKIGPRKTPKTKGGFFREIKADRGGNPSQRVRYDEHSGIIWIYVKFPGTSRYFEDNLEFNDEGSRAMYAELVGEAFCRLIARDYIESGKVPRILGGEIDAVTIAMSMAQEQYLHHIHDAVLRQKL